MSVTLTIIIVVIDARGSPNWAGGRGQVVVTV